MVVMVVVRIVVVVGTGHALSLQALVVSFDPLHFLPPLEACCMIVLKPDCVPPPHVLSHECQVHLPHLQFTGRGRGGLGGDGGSQADTMLMHCEQISVKLEILLDKNPIYLIIFAIKCQERGSFPRLFSPNFLTCNAARRQTSLQNPNIVLRLGPTGDSVPSERYFIRYRFSVKPP